MKNRKKRIVWAGFIVMILVVAAVILSWNKPEWFFNTAKVETETVKISVMATGYVQPMEEVEVGTQVSGVIEKIYVDYNSHVKAGQLIAELDKSTLNERLVQANASLASAESDLLYAEQNYNRVNQLHSAKAATDVSLEEAVNRLATARTALDNARANANQAKVNLSYADIYSPINGVVLDRAVNEGQTVAASFSTPTLFTIAEDLTKMQVEVDVDEADIGQVRLGQRAEFTVDAYSDEVFEGTVLQIRLQPTVTNNVVTYTVVVAAPNPEEKLYPGMTANITIEVNAETGLTIPLEALNFKMAPEMKRQFDTPQTGPEPGARGQEAAPSPPAPAGGAGQRTVWVKDGDGIEPRQIETGIGDGIHVIVTSGLREGEEVVLSATLGKEKDRREATRNPLMPSPRRR